jgi:hypothetical protein
MAKKHPFGKGWAKTYFLKKSMAKNNLLEKVGPKHTFVRETSEKQPLTKG